MTDEQKIAYVKVYADDSSMPNETATAFLARAAEAILNQRYPFNRPTNATVPAQYEMLQCELAAAMFGNRGIGDVVSHEEHTGGTGISETYSGSAQSYKHYLAQVIPISKVT